MNAPTYQGVTSNSQKALVFAFMDKKIRSVCRILLILTARQRTWQGAAGPITMHLMILKIHLDKFVCDTRVEPVAVFFEKYLR